LIEYWGSAAPKEELPYTARDVFALTASVCWVGEENDAIALGVCRDFEEKLSSLKKSNTQYWNYASDATIEQSHGSANLKKLFELKKKWDPQHVFPGTLDAHTLSGH